MIETRNVHAQLLELCQQQLAAGRWTVGERFPSERELAAEYGISRATANKVLAKLASEGWLEIRRGAGAFVADRPTLFSELRQMDSFTQFAQANKLQPTTEVVDCDSLASASEAIYHELDLAPRQRVIYVERLRRLNGEPVIHEQRWLPGKLYPRLTKQALTGSFYALCRERYRLQIDREDATVHACLPPASSALTGVALRLTGAGYDPDGLPLWRQELYYAGDCFEMHHSAETTASIPRLSLRLRPEFLERISSN